MSKFQQSLKVLAVAIGVGALSACQSLNFNAPVPVAKVDNGLGDLPHYRDWIDPTGHSPMGQVVTATDSARRP